MPNQVRNKREEWRRPMQILHFSLKLCHIATIYEEVGWQATFLDSAIVPHWKHMPKQIKWA